MNEGKIVGISGIRNESDLKDPVRLVCELKRDADPDIVLNQLYQFSPLQDTFSLNFLALVDGKPRVLSFKELLQEFIRHRETVIRRRTQFLLGRARQRKHTVEGLLLAHANIDEVIRVIRSSSTQAEAKERLMKIQTPAALLRRALGEEGFGVFAEERGLSEFYTLTPVQADAILKKPDTVSMVLEKTSALTKSFAPKNEAVQAKWREMIEDPDLKIARPRQLYVGPNERKYLPMSSR